MFYRLKTFGPGKIEIAKGSVAARRRREVGISELDIREFGVAECGASEVGFAHIGPEQFGRNKMGTTEVDSVEVDVGKDRAVRSAPRRTVLPGRLRGAQLRIRRPLEVRHRAGRHR